MKPKIDVKAIIKKAKEKEPKRVKVSFTFDSEVYKEFNENCVEQEIAMSRVLEELMVEFNNSLKYGG